MDYLKLQKSTQELIGNLMQCMVNNANIGEIDVVKYIKGFDRQIDMIHERYDFTNEDIDIQITFYPERINCYVESDMVKRSTVYISDLTYVDYKLIKFIRDSIKFIFELEESI